MVHSQKEIVLSLVLFTCQSVLLLETGYDYCGNDVIENNRLHDDLKCAYLFSSLTHMLLMQILIGPAYNTPIALQAANQSNYSYTIKHQIASLFSLNSRRIRSLWLVHLYMNLVPGLPKNSKDIQADYLKLVTTHEFVIKRLRKDLTGCPKGNMYDRFDAMMNATPDPTQDDLKDMVYRNYYLAKNLLYKNRICSKSYNGKCMETLKIRRLFMNNIDSRSTFVHDLMNAFNVQMSWSDVTKVRLEKSYLDAHTLDWAADNVQNLKLYYTLNYSFVKIIMFRLTSIHMTYLQHYPVGSTRYVYYARKWFQVVEKFGIMLNLTDDLHVSSLLTAINNLYDGTEQIDDVASYVYSILASLCLSIGCRPIEPFDVHNKEFQIPYETSKNYVLKGWENSTTGREPIEYNSLENARVFLVYLGRMFDNVDFSLIRLLMEYIDEIKQENELETFNDNFNIFTDRSVILP